VAKIYKTNVSMVEISRKKMIRYIYNYSRTHHEGTKNRFAIRLENNRLARYRLITEIGLYVVTNLTKMVQNNNYNLRIEIIITHVSL
jgi:hypothetical protein